MARLKAHGICKLTGKPGKFVKSHLLPQAFTRPNIPGEFFISGGEGSRPKRSWTSWYDPELVIQEGEDILADYDSWASSELRGLQLVWSGWGTKSSLSFENWKGTLPGGYGIRQLECHNASKLRLFFLSLLWRAASTGLEGFGAVKLDHQDLERLRVMVLTRSPEPLDFFPMSALQLVTRGFDHNLGPVALDWGDINVGSRPLRYRFFRFYFDGLIVHFYRNNSADFVDMMKLHIVGMSSTLWVQTQTFENSFQMWNMRQHIIEGQVRTPDIIKRLTADQRKRGHAAYD